MILLHPSCRSIHTTEILAILGVDVNLLQNRIIRGERENGKQQHFQTSKSIGKDDSQRLTDRRSTVSSEQSNSRNLESQKAKAFMNANNCASDTKTCGMQNDETVVVVVVRKADGGGARPDTAHKIVRTLLWDTIVQVFIIYYNH